MKETPDSLSPQWCYSPRRPMKSSPQIADVAYLRTYILEFADVLLDSKGVTVPEESASGSDNRICNNEENKCPANTRRTRQAAKHAMSTKAGVAKARWRAHVVDVL